MSPQSDRADTTAVDEGNLMTPAEVAELFRVDPKTVTRWATKRRIQSVRTPGGHRRFKRQDIADLLNEYQ